REIDRGKAASMANACAARLAEDPNNVPAREKFARLLAERLNKPDLAIEQMTLLLNMPDQENAKRAEWLGLTAAWHIRYRIGPKGSGKSLFADAIRGMLPLVAGEMTYHFKGIAGLSAEECIGHVSFQERKSELHGTVVQSRWNSMEEHATLTVAQFLSYEHTMGINPFE